MCNDANEMTRSHPHLAEPRKPMCDDADAIALWLLFPSPPFHTNLIFFNIINHEFYETSEIGLNLETQANDDSSFSCLEFDRLVASELNRLV